jgi:outer membrane lipoprotein-sorting protein
MMIKSTRFILLLLALLTGFVGKAQDINSLIAKVKFNIDKVNDYEAIARMVTNVSFLKVPDADVRVYFKRPNKLKIKNEKGISFVPKGAVSINLNNILSGNKYTAIDAGTDKIGNTMVRVVKLLPEDDNADVVLSTIYIDETALVILKAKTTTRANGSYVLEMNYGKYAAYGLPDKIIFSFDTKDYKLPKGVTFDFDDGTQTNKTAGDKAKSKNGKAEITFSSYKINKGVADDIFK